MIEPGEGKAFAILAGITLISVVSSFVAFGPWSGFEEQRKACRKACGGMATVEVCEERFADCKIGPLPHDVVRREIK